MGKDSHTTLSTRKKHPPAPTLSATSTRASLQEEKGAKKTESPPPA